MAENEVQVASGYARSYSNPAASNLTEREIVRGKPIGGRYPARTGKTIIVPCVTKIVKHGRLCIETKN
jgi:hypothetical protein